MKGLGLVSDWCIVDVHGGISAAENRSGNYGWDSVRIPTRMELDAFWFGRK